MARGRAGRKRSAGNRYPNGRLRPVRDGGNDRVQAHREPYLRFGQVKAVDDLDCALGQAHAAGLLEGMRVDGRVLLEHGREYHRLHRGAFGGSVRTCRFERVDRSTPSLAVTSADLRFRMWSKVVARLDPVERRILHLVCIEHGDGWSLPHFLQRLINSWKARQRPSLYEGADLPADTDFAMLDALKSALLALVDGDRARRRGSLRHATKVVSTSFTNPI